MIVEFVEQHSLHIYHSKAFKVCMKNMSGFVFQSRGSLIKWIYVLLFSLDIDECSSAPCGNLATCSDEANGYNCTCLAGYTGEHCETGKTE